MEPTTMTAPAEDGLRQQLIDGTRELLPRILRRELPELSDQTRLMEDLRLTSSTLLELLLELEERLEIQINVEEIDEDGVETVGNLADFIVGHLLTDD